MVGAEIIKNYFPGIDNSKLELFEKLGSVYAEENEKVNLISRKDFENLYSNHILHSLALANFCEFLPGQAVVDIGTGGGFPGIPLAIMYPDTKFVLCDSIGKKIRAVQAVIDALRLTNVEAINSRTESLPYTFDIAVARAVAPAASLWDWMLGKWNNKAVFYLLKGGDLREELNELLDFHPKLIVMEYAISDFINEPFYETKKVVTLIA